MSGDSDGVELRSEDEAEEDDDASFIDDSLVDDTSASPADDTDPMVVDGALGRRRSGVIDRYTDTEHVHLDGDDDDSGDGSEEGDDEGAGAAGPQVYIAAVGADGTDEGDGRVRPPGAPDKPVVVDGAAYGKVVSAKLLRPGERYLVFAPAADRGGVHGGSTAGAARAGIGVLSAVGHAAEFRLCTHTVRGDDRYTHKGTKGVRDVELEELCAFRFIRKLRSAAAPSLPTEMCLTDDDVFAVAVGLLRPSGAKNRLGTGLLVGCTGSDWGCVRELRQLSDEGRESKNGSRNWAAW
jgi:hypothetical protein